MSRFRTEIIGDAILILGDCRDVLADMPPCFSVDAVVTSPPYGQQRDYGAKIIDWRSLVSGALTRTPNNGRAQVLVNLGPIHRDGELVLYWNDLIEDMRSSGYRLFGWYVWDQLSGQAGNWSGRLAPSHEFVFHFNREARQPNKTKRTQGYDLGRKINGPGVRKPDGSSASKTGHGDGVQPFKIPDSVLRLPRDTANVGAHIAHPARFPVAFATELVAAYSDAVETVLDPFMGSGTTGVSCANLGRKFIGIEIDTGYFDIACRRIEEAYKQPRLFDEPGPKPVQSAIDFSTGDAE